MVLSKKLLNEQFLSISPVRVYEGSNNEHGCVTMMRAVCGYLCLSVASVIEKQFVVICLAHICLQKVFNSIIRYLTCTRMSARCL